MISDEFPGWEAWQSLIGKQWHARLKGAQPPVMVHGNTEDDLREKIREMLEKKAGR
jgi:hypothetical protein